VVDKQIHRDDLSKENLYHQDEDKDPHLEVKINALNHLVKELVMALDLEL
jgi:hypothetical protein